MTIPIEIQQAVNDALDRQRRRIVGMVLAEFAVRQMAGDEQTARVLDTVAVRRSSALSQKPSSNSLALSKPGGARSPVPSRQAVLKGVHSGTRGVAGALAQPPVQDLLARCIFRVRGSIVGVVVSGCCSQEAEGREDVWNIPDVPATLTELNRTCDMFNSWAEANLATGARANLLVRLWAARDGELTVTADSVAFGATKAIGFFGTGPFEPSWKKYSFNGTEAVGDRNLRRAGPELVLAQLLLDLGNLGLIRRGP